VSQRQAKDFLSHYPGGAELPELEEGQEHDQDQLNKFDILTAQLVAAENLVAEREPPPPEVPLVSAQSDMEFRVFLFNFLGKPQNISLFSFILRFYQSYKSSNPIVPKNLIALNDGNMMCVVWWCHRVGVSQRRVGRGRAYLVLARQRSVGVVYSGPRPAGP